MDGRRASRHPVGMIEVNDLSKRYGSQLAVDGVSFRCEPGTITGFLGPNGAGKSTTLRMIMRPHAADARAARPCSARATASSRTPAARSASCSTPPRSTRAAPAARCWRSRRGVLGVDRRRVPELLDRVGLPASAAKKRVGNYSLGMRQRLGIAQALLGEPSVLILDEPANGLDPEGIFWMRELLRDFADRAGTVLLSSHLLREIEVIADDLVVIGDGKIVAQGSKAELLAATGLAGPRARQRDALRRPGRRGPQRHARRRRLARRRRRARGRRPARRRARLRPDRAAPRRRRRPRAAVPDPDVCEERRP